MGCWTVWVEKDGVPVLHLAPRAEAAEGLLLSCLVLECRRLGMGSCPELDDFNSSRTLLDWRFQMQG